MFRENNLRLFRGIMMRVFDCFIYNDEDIVYERIRLLGDVVSIFYIVEGSHTFQGDLKPAQFDMGQVPEKYREKIKYSIVDLSFAVSGLDAWEVETCQRNALMGVLDLADENDLILISDVDEIPRPSLLRQANTIKPSVLSMWSCYFYIDYVCETHMFWNKAIAINKKFLKILGPEASFEGLRKGYYDRKLGRINRAGWHFSYLGGVDTIYRKLMVFSHTELNSFKDVSRVEYERKIENGVDIFDRVYTWGRMNRLPREYEELNLNEGSVFMRSPKSTTAVRYRFVVWAHLRNAFKLIQASVRYTRFQKVAERKVVPGAK